MTDPTTEDSVPHLTKVRWLCLMALKASPVLMNRPFLAHELKYGGRKGGDTPARGATMYALESAGWVKRAVFGGKGDRMPFRSGGPVTAWEVTLAGKEAVAACPDTFPGEPVYGQKP